MKNLPTGTQTFEILINNNCVYVDKTKYLVDIIKNGRLYFFARPRRFGKSLAVSALEAMFLGKKELFKGFYAEKWMNRPDFKTHPVITLSLNSVSTEQGLDALILSFKKHIYDVADTLDIQLPNRDTAGDLFDDLSRCYNENTTKK
jgi:hypothetical protein